MERPRVDELERELRALVESLPEEDPDGGPPDAETIADATTRWSGPTEARTGEA